MFNCNATFRQVFESEAREITDYLKGVHHSRKISHQQVNYSETVQKLSQLQAQNDARLTMLSTASVGQVAKLPITMTATDKAIMNKQMKLSEFQDQLNKNIAQEHFMNERKRAFNREASRQAVVDKVRS